jgi:S1-C subfamily serine protease
MQGPTDESMKYARRPGNHWSAFYQSNNVQPDPCLPSGPEWECPRCGTPYEDGVLACACRQFRTAHAGPPHVRQRGLLSLFRRPFRVRVSDRQHGLLMGMAGVGVVFLTTLGALVLGHMPSPIEAADPATRPPAKKAQKPGGRSPTSTVLPFLDGFWHPVPPPAREGVSSQEIIGRVKPSVVLVTASVPRGVSSGTGFVVGPGEVATCAHVVNGASRITLVTAEGHQLKAALVATDSLYDVAVLRCGEELPAALALGMMDIAREGDEIAVTGYPVMSKFLEMGYVPTSSTTRGTVSARRTRLLDGKPVEELQIDAAINSGVSGGPVYSIQDGTVLGLASAKMLEEQGIGFATPVDALRRLLER